MSQMFVAGGEKKQKRGEKKRITRNLWGRRPKGKVSKIQIST